MIESVTPTSGGGATLATISDMSPLMRTVNDDTTQAAALTTLGAQPLDTDLTAIAALTSAANKLPYSTGSGTWALADLSVAARTVLDDATVGAMVTTLGAQPLDTDLTAIAALTSAANKLPYSTGAGTWALADLSAAARTVLDDATVGAMLTTLGAPASVDVQTFTADGTWTKPTGAKTVTVLMWGSGGGGGGGRRGAASTDRGGGGGGGAGGRTIVQFKASDLSATEAVVVGYPGYGGDPAPTDSSNGSQGNLGIASSFKNVKTSVGTRGAAGTATAGTGGAASTSIMNFVVVNTGAGGASSLAATAGVGTLAYLHPSGGGGGGSISAANVEYSGGDGGIIADGSATTFLAGALGGIINVTRAGANGSTTPHGGNGGGGGAAESDGVTAAGKGGNGGIPGGGGAGGGASTNGAASGQGGEGGRGEVIVITYF